MSCESLSLPILKRSTSFLFLLNFVSMDRCALKGVPRLLTRNSLYLQVYNCISEITLNKVANAQTSSQWIDISWRTDSMHFLWFKRLHETREDHVFVSSSILFPFSFYFNAWHEEAMTKRLLSITCIAKQEDFVVKYSRIIIFLTFSIMFILFQRST